MPTVNITIGGEDILADLNQRIVVMQQALQDLTAAVTHNTTVTASAVTLIQGLADKLDAVAGDEAAVRALTADIRSAADQLASAVTENTSESESAAEPQP